MLSRGAPQLDWDNSHHLRAIDDIAALKQTEGPDLVIQGSSTLYPPLLAAGLIDRLTLMIFPAVLGTGKRLFGPRHGRDPLRNAGRGRILSAIHRPRRRAARRCAGGRFLADRPA
ncbi:MAG: dihydrofolate reductase family protein [Erythrobacter sp.]|nr:dihydrofolate reductase family protein [Erythrobacter sp.]